MHETKAELSTAEAIAAAFPETIAFGGKTWKRRIPGEPGEVNYDADRETGGEYFYIHRYPSGSWCWQHQFPEKTGIPEAFDNRTSGLVDSLEDAMRAAIDSTFAEHIQELLGWLDREGLLAGSDAFEAGIAAGRKQVFAEIENLKTAA